MVVTVAARSSPSPILDTASSRPLSRAAAPLEFGQKAAKGRGGGGGAAHRAAQQAPGPLPPHFDVWVEYAKIQQHAHMLEKIQKPKGWRESSESEGPKKKMAVSRTPNVPAPKVPAGWGVWWSAEGRWIYEYPDVGIPRKRRQEEERLSSCDECANDCVIL